MVNSIQISTAILILLSFVLVVGVPVVLASPGEWERNQKTVYSGTVVWSIMVMVTTFLNSLA